MSQKPLKAAAAKTFLPSAYIIDATCMTFLVIQIYCYPEVWCNRDVAAFFKTSVLKEVLILYPLSPQ